MNSSYTLALVGALVVTGASAAFAGMSTGYVENRRQAETRMNTQTVGEQLAQGRMTVPQVMQLIQFTGLSLDDAQGYTVPEITAMRWAGN